MQPITFDYLKVHNRFISPFDQSSGFCCFPKSRHGQPPEHTSSGHCFSLLACFSLFDGSLRALEIYMDPHLALSPSMIATDNSQLINYYYPQLISFVASGDKGQIVVHQITAGDFAIGSISAIHDLRIAKHLFPSDHISSISAPTMQL